MELIDIVISVEKVGTRVVCEMTVPIIISIPHQIGMNGRTIRSAILMSLRVVIAHRGALGNKL
jgi:hypothetical protein